MDDASWFFESNRNRLRKSLNTNLPSSSQNGAANCCVVVRPYQRPLSKPLAARFTPSSCNAVRLTSANRTRSSTCRDADAALLLQQVDDVLLLLDVARRRRRRPSRSTYLPDTSPESTTSLPLLETEMRSPGNSCASRALSSLRSRCTFDLIARDAARPVPDEQGDRPWRLAVQQQLLRRGHHRVGHVRRRQRHARDGLAHRDRRWIGRRAAGLRVASVPAASGGAGSLLRAIVPWSICACGAATLMATKSATARSGLFWPGGA